MTIPITIHLSLRFTSGLFPSVTSNLLTIYILLLDLTNTNDSLLVPTLNTPMPRLAMSNCQKVQVMVLPSFWQ